MAIRDAESERPPACDPATAGASKGRTREPQLVQVTGSSRRAWRWLIRGARRRGQYLAGCEPVCGGITCSGRQDACPRLSPIANRGTALRAARCRGHDHPSSAVLFGATEPLQRAVDSSQSSELSRWMSTRSDMSVTSSLHRTRRAQSPGCLGLRPFCAVELLC